MTLIRPPMEIFRNHDSGSHHTAMANRINRLVTPNQYIVVRKTLTHNNGIIFRA